jgi:hypothetical protein
MTVAEALIVLGTLLSMGLLGLVIVLLTRRFERRAAPPGTPLPPPQVPKPNDPSP